MNTNKRKLGTVKLVQLQPQGLIYETPSGEIYDPARRLEAEHITITHKGIETITEDGERLLDIHHLEHPQTRFRGDDLVCIGFTSHYHAMRDYFGEHIIDGAAGENIIIEYDQEVWLADLGERIAFQNPQTGQNVYLDVKEFAAPCEEFSHFAANSQLEPLPPEKLKSTLQFLTNGRRGFLLMLSPGQESGVVANGDQVFVVK